MTTAPVQWTQFTNSAKFPCHNLYYMLQLQLKWIKQKLVHEIKSSNNWMHFYLGNYDLEAVTLVTYKISTMFVLYEIQHLIF